MYYSIPDKFSMDYICRRHNAVTPTAAAAIIVDADVTAYVEERKDETAD